MSDPRSPADITFGPDGGLTEADFGGLQRLDGSGLGSAIAYLVAQASWLPPDVRLSAEDATWQAFVAGTADGSPVQLDATGLVEIYRRVASDANLQDVRELLVRLFATMNLDDVLGVISTDASGLSLRARLETDIRGGTAAVAADDGGGTRGGGTRGIDEWLQGAGGGEAVMDDALPEGALPEAKGLPEGTPPDDRPIAHAKPPDHEAAMRNGGGEANGGAHAEAEEGPAPRRYKAYGLLACDETVLAGRSFPLELGLSKRQAEGVAGGPLNVPLPEPEQPYTLDIQLFADGFDLDDGEAWRQSLQVAQTADEATLYPSVTVHLTARPQMEPLVDRKVSATFSIDGETLGLAERHVQVTNNEADLAAPGTPATPAAGLNIAAPTGEPKAHVTITLRDGADDGDLVWGLESTLPGIGLPDGRQIKTKIGKNPQAFTKELIQDLYLQGHGAGLFQLLQGIGKTVRNAMPPEVRDAIAAAGQAVKPDPLHILLLTEEPFVPWELAYVDAPWEANAPSYLGAQAVMGRWVLGPAVATDPRRNVDVRSMAVVSGVYTKLQRLLAAEAEAAALATDYHASPIDAQPQPVSDLLGGTPGADILHFAVHGRYDPDGAGDGIYLVSGPPVSPLQIVGSDLTARAPFVFLNACQVGAAGEKLGDYNGIAAAFLQAGASAVIAPLWSVDDTIAQQIALGFYQAAIGAQAAAAAGGPAAGEPPLVAELLREARAGLVAHAADRSATYLAYQFYGHPSLRLSWRGAAAPAAPGAAGGPGGG